MGKAGPAATPIPIRKLSGETRPSQINPDGFEPDVLDELPNPPAWLPRGARAVWRRVGSELVRYRILAGVDLDLFGHYCEAVWTAQRAAIELEAGAGLTISQLVAKRTDGTLAEQTVVRPAFRAWREAVQTMRQIAGEFGLSPAIRASVKLPGSGSGEADKDEAARLLS